MGKASRIPTSIDRLKEQQIRSTALFALNRVRIVPKTIQAPSGGAAAVGGGVGGIGNFLPLSGGVMTGNIAFDPKVIDAPNGRVNLDPGGEDPKDSSNVLVLGIGTSPFNIRFIDGAQRNGQFLLYQGTNQQLQNIQNAITFTLTNIVGDGTTNIITATVSSTTGLSNGTLVDVSFTTAFNKRDAIVANLTATTFTYDLGVIGSATPETVGTAQTGNIFTNDGNTLVLDGTASLLGAPVILLKFDDTLPAGGGWRPATLGGGAGINLLPLDNEWTGINTFSGGINVRTANFKIQNTADPTKQLDFSLAGAVTGKTMSIVSNHQDDRILTLPDATTTLAGLGVTSQTWTGLNIFSGGAIVRDGNFTIQNTADITKQAVFSALLISTGTVKTFTFPNANTTLAGLSVAQTFTALNTYEGGIQINDSASAIHGLLQGVISTGVKLTLTAGEKFQIFDSATDILEINLASGLNMLNHNIVMGTGEIIAGGAAKEINNIGELVFVNNTLTPAGNGILFFDGTDLKAKTGATTVNLTNIGGANFTDAVFRVTDELDLTKKFALDVGSNTTGITATLKFAATANRTLTFPDVSATVFVTPAFEDLNLNTFDINNLDALLQQDTGHTLLHTFARPETLVDNSVIGEIRFRAFDGIGTINNYASIKGVMANDINTGEDGVLQFFVAEAGNHEVKYMEMDGDLKQAQFFKPISMFGNSILLDNDGDTSINSFSDDSIQFIIGGSPRGSWSNSALVVENNFTVKGGLILLGDSLINDRLNVTARLVKKFTWELTTNDVPLSGELAIGRDSFGNMKLTVPAGEHIALQVAASDKVRIFSDRIETNHKIIFPISSGALGATQFGISRSGTEMQINTDATFKVLVDAVEIAQFGSSFLQFPEVVADPAAGTTSGKFYVKTVGGLAKPFFIGDGTAAVDLSGGGGGDVFLANSQTFTGINTFNNATNGIVMTTGSKIEFENASVSNLEIHAESNMRDPGDLTITTRSGLEIDINTGAEPDTEVFHIGDGQASPWMLMDDTTVRFNTGLSTAVGHEMFLSRDNIPLDGEVISTIFAQSKISAAVFLKFAFIQMSAVDVDSVAANNEGEINIGAVSNNSLNSGIKIQGRPGVTGVRLGFYNTTPVNQQTLAANPTNTEISTVLRNLGLTIL